MTLAEWSERYTRLRADAVRAAYNGDAMLMVVTGEKLAVLPSYCCCETCKE